MPIQKKAIASIITLLSVIGVAPHSYAAEECNGPPNGKVATPQNAPDQALNDPALKKAISLGSETSFDIGGEVSGYRYQEQVNGANFVHESGAKVGITATGTLALTHGFFVTGDSRFAYSSNDYGSSAGARQKGVNDYLGDVRLLGGKDFVFRNIGPAGNNFSLSPYVGLGYRNLYNDLRGTAVTIVNGSPLVTHGYRRDSEYFYLPVGVTPRFRVTDDARISTDLEYDKLLIGRQTSYGNDVSPFEPDIVNNQYHGYGLRTNIMYETDSWSVGPFLEYWDIKKSEPTTFLFFFSSYEPQNQTIEYGIRAHYNF